MGEAKRRGTQAERVTQAKSRLDALRPEKLVCGACQTAFTEFEGMEPRDMPGIHAIFGGECPNCGELKRPHHVCPSCGHYNDKEIVALVDDIDLDEDAA